MKKLHSFLLYCLLFAASTYSMEPEQSIIPNHVPQDISEYIIFHQLLDIHNQVNTPEEARDYLCTLTLINKECHKYANNPHIVKNIISNLSNTLISNRGYSFKEATIAKKLNTPATKQYIALNNQFFSEHLTVVDIKNMLQQGADPNYRRNVKKEHDPALYDQSRHYVATSPIIFYASGSTDNDLEIMQCLLEHGADINKRVNYQRPLVIAIYFNLPKTVSLLLEYNPTFSNTPHSCQNYLTFAMERKNPEIINMLMNVPCADFHGALKTSVEKKNLEEIQDLFDHGATPDMQLKEVVKHTIVFPYPSYGRLETTEILQLFCNNGIQNEQLIDECLTYARTAKQRAKEVIKILKQAKK